VTDGENERPAAAVITWRRHAVDLDATTREQARLLYAGYECNKAAVLAFVESELPLPGLADAHTERAVAHLARQLVAATSEVNKALQRALGKSLKNEADGIWQKTETDFYRLLRIAPLPPDAPVEQPLAEAATEWLYIIKKAALQIFDTARPLLDPHAADPARIVADRRFLTGVLAGYFAAGKRLFSALLLPVPKAKAKSP
jgi:hypothetical protein